LNQDSPAGYTDQVAADLSRRFPGFEPDPQWDEVAQVYPAFSSAYYLGLIRRPAPDDPVFRQVAPSPLELFDQGEDDPVEERRYSPVPGLIRRYADRALVMPSSRCFVRCRHCMRKRMWAESDADEEKIQGWRRWLEAHPEVGEVILSGGDPLSLPDLRLARLLDLLLSVKSVRAIRVHSRAVAVAPARITEELATLLSRRRVRRLVTQFNHPVEVTAGARAAAEKLGRAGIRVENQSVLLRGVNDRAEVLAELFLSARRIGVEPYYLHHPDPVKGAMHFTLGLSEGLKIYEQARGLAGGCAPAYVVDRPGSGVKEAVEGLGALA
jgi:lysine 2,3-aminomutase